MTKLFPLIFALLVMTQTAFAQSDPIDEQCRDLMTNTDPNTATESDNRIQIVTPSNNNTIYGEQVTVIVEAGDFEIAENSGHWHLWIDDQLLGMIYQPATTITLAPGTYRLCAILGDATHFDTGSPDGIMLTVAAGDTGAAGSESPQQSEQPVFAPPQPESSSPNIVLIVIGLAVAIVGGWFIGGRMGRRRG